MQSIGPRGQPGRLEQVLGLDVDAGRRSRAARISAPRTIPASVDAPGQRARQRPEKLLELEIEADIAVIDRQAADRRAGERRAGRGGGDRTGRSFGGERRVAGQQLVGAVAPSATVTSVRANRLRRWVGRIEASPNGSSSQPATSGK